MANVGFDSASAVIDGIYEAAFIPECWPKVLEQLASISGAASGWIAVFDDIRLAQFQATDIVRGALESFQREGHWKDNQRIQYFHQNPFTGFVTAEQYYPPGFLDNDRPYHDRIKIGLRAQVGTMIPMPSGELVVCTFERWDRDGDFGGGDVERLNLIHPHLVRAGLMSARLGLERARAKVAALAALGLPAAALVQSGRVLATNDLLDALTSIFLPVAYGRMAIGDTGADRLFQAAMAATLDMAEPVVRSIPVAAREKTPALVMHVLPLRHSTHDLFSGGDVLVVATMPNPSGLVPSPTTGVQSSLHSDGGLHRYPGSADAQRQYQAASQNRRRLAGRSGSHEIGRVDMFPPLLDVKAPAFGVHA